MSGVLCVMTPGITMMLLWCVDSWSTPLKVSGMHQFCGQLSKDNLDQQVQWPSTVLILVLVLVQSTWTMLTAVEVKVISLNVYIAPMSPVSMATHRMLE